MVIPVEFFLTGIIGFVYLIVAGQVSSGFPPFYEKAKKADELQSLMPFMFVLMVLLGAAVFIPYLFIAFGAGSAWCGVRVRRMVRERTNGPLPWLLTPLTISIMDRWPMLPFDVWTLGFTAFMGLIMLM
jgi:hypothetical protein